MTLSQSRKMKSCERRAYLRRIRKLWLNPAARWQQQPGCSIATLCRPRSSRLPSSAAAILVPHYCSRSDNPSLEIIPCSATTYRCSVHINGFHHLGSYTLRVHGLDHKALVGSNRKSDVCVQSSSAGAVDLLIVHPNLNLRDWIHT